MTGTYEGIRLDVFVSISACAYLVSVTPTALNLAELRRKAGLTQGVLAEKVGVRQATISDLETGKSRRIELDLLDRLAKALRCKPSDLIVRAAKKGR